MLDYQPVLLTVAGVSTVVMRVVGDSQELIPQIHLGSRATQRGKRGRQAVWLCSFSGSHWHERIWSLNNAETRRKFCKDSAASVKIIKILHGINGWLFREEGSAAVTAVVYTIVISSEQRRCLLFVSERDILELRKAHARKNEREYP